jgi:class 3 adenylate cyclase
LNSEIGVRIGVTSGLAFAGDIGTADQPAYVVVGRPVDLARWLSAAAAPGEVLLAGPVVTTLAAPPPIEQLAPRVFAGDAEPIPVYRVRQ